jgi:hypothetical protein
MRATKALLTAVALCLIGGLAFGQDAVKKKKAKKERAGTATAVWTETFAEEESDLASTGKNPYFILQPGHRLVYEESQGDKKTRLVITVLAETRKVGNVETRIVEERETENGELTEISRNYYAISRRTNNVYYFGEDVDEYKDGKVTGHGGTWLAGVEGATYGLMMAGTPLVGARYCQEVAPGKAMDRAEVVSLAETLETKAGAFKGCLKTEETTPLEPGSKAYKIYAPGVGLIKDGGLELVECGPAKE